MVGAAVGASTPLCFSAFTRIPNSTQPFSHGHSFSLSSPSPLHFPLRTTRRRQPHLLAQPASSSFSGEILLSLFQCFLFVFSVSCLSLFLQLYSFQFPGKLTMQIGVHTLINGIAVIMKIIICKLLVRLSFCFELNVNLFFMLFNLIYRE